ncbi:MAG: hypothetical protein SOW01_06555 [Mediterranea sp.]|nr:hypothetical protein [Mediterranea sp.]
MANGLELPYNHRMPYPDDFSSRLLLPLPEEMKSFRFPPCIPPSWVISGRKIYRPYKLRDPMQRSGRRTYQLFSREH